MPINDSVAITVDVAEGSVLLGLAKSLAARTRPPALSGTVAISNPGDVYDSSTVQLAAVVTGDGDTLTWYDGVTLIGSVAVGATQAWEVDGEGDHSLTVELYAGSTFRARQALIVTVLEEVPPAPITVDNPGAVYEGVTFDVSAATTGTVTSVVFDYTSNDTDYTALGTDSSGTTSWSVADVTITTSGPVTIRARAYSGVELVATGTRVVAVGTRTAAWQAAGFTEDGDEVWDPDADHTTLASGSVDYIIGRINAYHLAAAAANDRPAWAADTICSAPGFTCVSSPAKCLRATDAELLAHFTGTDCSIAVGCVVQLTVSESSKAIAGAWGNGASHTPCGAVYTSGVSFAARRGSAASLVFTGLNLRPQHLSGRFSGLELAIYRGDLCMNFRNATGGAVTPTELSFGGCRTSGAVAYAANAKYGTCYVTSHPETIDWTLVERILESTYPLGLSDLPTLAAGAIVVTTDAQAHGPGWDAISEVITRQPTVPAAMLHCGDTVQIDGAEAEVHEFFAPLTWCDPTWADPAKARLWTAYGNHDNDGGSAWSHLMTHSSGESSVLETGVRYGTFDASSLVDIVVADSSDLTTGRATQETWFAGDLAASTKPWQLAAWHYTTYPGTTWAYSTGIHSFSASLGLVARCEAANVPIVFSGHTHMSWATVALLNGAPNAAGVVYLNVGRSSARNGAYVAGATVNPTFTGTENVVDSVIPRTDAFDCATSVQTWAEQPYVAFATVEPSENELRVRLWHVEQKVAGQHKVYAVYDHTFEKAA